MPQTVAGFLAQTVPTWELVAVGTGADPVLSGIRDPRVRRAPVNVRDGNWAAALNRAAALTQSPFIAFSDGNTVPVAERLELQSTFLASHRQFEWVSGWSEAPSTQGGWTRRAFANAEPDTLLAALLHENPFRFGTVMVSRACFEALDGFDEGVPGGTDHDLWLRIGLRSRLAALPTVMCREMPEGHHVQRAAQTGPGLPDDRRRHYIERLLDIHPRGRSILEDALSRYPEDDALWNSHSRFRPPVRRPSREQRATPAAGHEGGDKGTTLDASVLWLRGLRHWVQAAPFNDLARECRRLGNPLLAYLCQLRSLTIDARQPSVFDQAYAAWSAGVADATGFSPPDAAEPSAACAVSVLIATYNRAHLIRESLESVLAQTFDDLELLTIDDGSTDHTEEVIRSFGDPRIRYIRASHRGVAAAFNTGAVRARGRYLAYLGDDDLFYPDHLARLVAAVEASQAPIVYSRQRVVSGHFESGRFSRELELGLQGGPYDEERHRRGCVIAPQGVLHRKECLVAVGGFDERLPVFEDWDLLVRMSERFRIIHLDAITSEYRKHRANLSSGHAGMGRLLHPLLRGYYASCRGGSILLRAASLQGRLSERDQLLTALQSAERLWRKTPAVRP